MVDFQCRTSKRSERNLKFDSIQNNPSKQVLSNHSLSIFHSKLPMQFLFNLCARYLRQLYKDEVEIIGSLTFRQRLGG